MNGDADRVNKYDVWDYAEGQDSYRISMLVDRTQPPDNVSDFCHSQYGAKHCCQAVPPRMGVHCPRIPASILRHDRRFKYRFHFGRLRRVAAVDGRYAP